MYLHIFMLINVKIVLSDKQSAHPIENYINNVENYINYINYINNHPG